MSKTAKMGIFWMQFWHCPDYGYYGWFAFLYQYGQVWCRWWARNGQSERWMLSCSSSQLSRPLITTVMPRALVALARAYWIRHLAKKSKSKWVFANEVMSFQKWLLQDEIRPFLGQTTSDIMTKAKTSRTVLYINPPWLIPTTVKEYVLCSTRWLIRFSRLLSFVLSLWLSIFLPLSISVSTFLGKHFMPEQSASAYLHHTPLPSLWPEVHKRQIFPVADPLRLTSVHAEAPGDPCVDAYAFKALTVNWNRAEAQWGYPIFMKPWITCCIFQHGIHIVKHVHIY